MLGEGKGEGGDVLHQCVADAAAFFFHGGGCREGDRFTQIYALELRSKVEGHEGNFFARALIIKLCDIHESFLKISDNMIVFFVMFRENDEIVSFLQHGEGGAEGVQDPIVLVNGNGARVVENQYGQRRDDVGSQFKKRPQQLRLFCPKIRVDISWNLFQLHHLTGAPGVAIFGKIQFAGDGTVKLSVISHEDARLLGKIFEAHNVHLRIKQGYKFFDNAKAPRLLFSVAQTLHLLLKKLFFSLVYRSFFNSASTEVQRWLMLRSNKNRAGLLLCEVSRPVLLS